MDIPSLFMIPSAVSSGKVHSVFPNSTDADFDFNRDSDATRVNSEGLIERVGYYGSEEITNGDFSNGYVGWSLSGNPSNYSVEVVDYAGRTNALHFTTTGANEGINQNVLQSSTTYYVRFDLKVISGSVYVGKNSARVTNADLSPSEWTTYAVNWTSADTYFRVYSATVGAEFYVDNVSVKEVTGDRARLNYEIEGGLVNTKPSLLLEPQSTNLLPYSEDYTQSDWQKLGLGNGSSPVITKDYAISPDGTQNATRLQCNLNGGTTVSDQSLIAEVYSSSGNQTISLYMKSNTGSNQNIYFANTVTSGDTAVVTNEWQRFTFSHSSSTYVLAVGLRGNTGADNTADILIFAAQAEQQSYPTSYIPTNGSTQTRAAETCNGSGTSSIFESSEGILFYEFKTNNTGLVSVTLFSSDNDKILIYGNTGNSIVFRIRVGGSYVYTHTKVGLDLKNTQKAALFFKNNNVKAYVNGVLVNSSTSAAITYSANTLASLNLDDATINDFYGKIRDIRVYNTKEMTDSEVDILLTKITS